MIFFCLPNRLQGGLAIGVFLVFGFDYTPRDGAAVFSFDEGFNRFQFGPVYPDRIDCLVPGGRVVLSGCADLERYSVMIEFAYAGNMVAVILEKLRQGHQIGMPLPKVACVGEYAGLLGVEPGEEG